MGVADFNIYMFAGGAGGNFLTNIIIIAISVLFLIGAIFAVVKFKRHRKLSIPLAEEIPLSDNRTALKMSKCGWFGKHQQFWGLKESGEQEVVTKDNRRILFVSSEDFTDINGRMGIRAIRKPDDPKVLIPVAKTTIKNKELILDIAPADYRDVAVRLVELEHENLAKTWEKHAPMLVAIGLMVVAIVIGTYMIQQGANTSKYILDKSVETSKILKSATQTINTMPATSSTAP